MITFRLFVSIIQLHQVFTCCFSVQKSCYIIKSTPGLFSICQNHLECSRSRGISISMAHKQSPGKKIMRSLDDSDTTFRRKMARRSCLNCQKSHRTCGKSNRTPLWWFTSLNNSDISISGNERPCLECKRRGIFETCVDGDRKIPKYLYDMSKKSPRVDWHCGASHSDMSSNAQRSRLNGTDHWALPSNPVNKFGATFAGQANPPEDYSTEQSPYGFVDPSILHIESPTLLLSRQKAQYQSQKIINLQTQSLTFNGGSLLMTPVADNHSHGIESVTCGKTIGFTINSGWSSTFLPCGVSEEPAGSINLW